PIFAELVLADEINRATPKSQSALLEAMEEGQDGVSHRLGFLNLAYTGACTDIPADGDVSMLNSSPDEVQ
ncbi:AAA family ATPase, partial [Ectopseudomonas hydrolytica]|uniref:AAA family ATPase n=1 Tax=Ectopseudomonas hydrolytica TaxID=2493633 RepID=UPI003C2F0312